MQHPVGGGVRGNIIILLVKVGCCISGHVGEMKRTVLYGASCPIPITMERRQDHIG